MSNVIRFLEQLGADAKLRHANPAELDSAMTAAGLDSLSRNAISASDGRQLEASIGAKSNVCAIIFHVEPDEDEGGGNKLRREASAR